MTEQLPALSEREIWKFTVEPMQVDMKMPKGARLIHAREQRGDVCVWAEVDPSAPKVRRYVRAIPTGQPTGGLEYVGTAHLASGSLVFHVYDGGEDPYGR